MRSFYMNTLSVEGREEDRKNIESYKINTF